MQQELDPGMGIWGSSSPQETQSCSVSTCLGYPGFLASTELREPKGACWQISFQNKDHMQFDNTPPPGLNISFEQNMITTLWLSSLR